MKLYYLDNTCPWQLSLQDSSLPITFGGINFYYFLMFFLGHLGLFVLWILLRALIHLVNPQENRTSSKTSDSSDSILVWTLVPAILLCFIVGPSFFFSYSYCLDDPSNLANNVNFVPNAEQKNALQTAWVERQAANRPVITKLNNTILKQRAELSQCPDVNYLNYYDNTSNNPHDLKNIFDLRCKTADAVIDVFENFNDPKPVTKEKYCAEVYETFISNPEFYTKGSRYYHYQYFDYSGYSEVPCEEIVRILGFDPIVVDAVDFDYKCYDDAKSFFNGCYDELAANEKTYISKRLEILGNHYNFDGYCDKFNKGKN